MASPADSICQYIATDLGLGTYASSGGDIFLDYLPDASDGTIDTAIAVYNVPGQPPELAVGSGQTDIDRPSFQTVCRALDADVARANDLAIFQALHGVDATTIHGTYFILIAAVQSAPVPLGRDERQRFMFARNYRAIVTGHTR